MELNFKCSCGAGHEVRVYDECRYCAKPISLLDWAAANLTSDDLQAILKQKGSDSGKTQTETITASGVVVEKRKGTAARK